VGGGWEVVIYNGMGVYEKGTVKKDFNKGNFG